MKNILKSQLRELSITGARGLDKYPSSGAVLVATLRAISHVVHMIEGGIIDGGGGVWVLGTTRLGASMAAAIAAMME